MGITLYAGGQSSRLEEALAPLLWMADLYQLTVSCDSKHPLTDVMMPDPKHAGVRYLYWKDNVRWWQNHLTTFRTSPFYRKLRRLHRQLYLFDSVSTSNQEATGCR